MLSILIIGFAACNADRRNNGDSMMTDSAVMDTAATGTGTTDTMGADTSRKDTTPPMR